MQIGDYPAKGRRYWFAMVGIGAIDVVGLAMVIAV
jgi:hypothetical protein